jgi:Mrp family chromosome partitioning ATPase/uncharacterized protein involved in exopolysaccharide biosynthesis
MNRLLSETSRSHHAAADPDPVDGAHVAHNDGAAPNPVIFVLSLLRGRYVLAIVLAVLGAGVGGAMGYLSQRPIYESTGLIRIRPNLSRILYQTDQNGIMPMFDSFVESQVALINGERVIRMAMEDREWLELGRGLSPEATLAFMQSLTVAHPRGSELIVVKAADPDPVAAQKAVGAVIRAYERRYGDEDPDSVGKRIAVLEERKAAFTNELNALNARIRDIANENGAPDLSSLYEFELSEQQKLESQWRQAELAVALAQGGPSTATTKPAVPSIDVAHLSPEMLAIYSSELRTLLTSRRELERRIGIERTRLGDQHRTVIDTQATLAAIEKDIDAEVKLVRELHAKGMISGPADPTLPGGGKSLERLQAEEQNIRLLLEKARAKAMDLGRKSLEMSSLKEEANGVKAKLDETKLRIDQLNLESNGSIDGRIKAEGYGDRPLAPAKDKRKMAAAAGAMGLGGMGVGLVLLLGLLDRRIRHVGDVHISVRHANRILGLLPHLPDSDVDAEQSMMAAHAVHQIRTMLERPRAEGENSVLAITSASPGAGKTSLAMALGLSFAASGAKTLLIDCDLIGGGLTAKMKWVARRRLGQILRREGLITAEQLTSALAAAKTARCRVGQMLVLNGLVTQADIDRALEAQSGELVGLREALNGDPINECITATGTPGLFLLPLGSAQRHHAAHLSAAGLQSLIDRVRPWFDVVLIDTGPVCGSLEASVVAMVAEEVVLTVARGDQRPLVQRAIDQLIASGANIAGIVLNRADSGDILESGFSSSMRSLPPGMDPTDVAPAPGQSAEHKYLRLGPIATAVAEQTDLTGPGSSRPARIIAETSDRE